MDLLLKAISHHWNKTDISKLIPKFAHLIDVDKDTLAKTDI